jgi:hypothetical protein
MKAQSSVDSGNTAGVLDDADAIDQPVQESICHDFRPRWLHRFLARDQDLEGFRAHQASGLQCQHELDQVADGGVSAARSLRAVKRLGSLALPGHCRVEQGVSDRDLAGVVRRPVGRVHPCGPVDVTPHVRRILLTGDALDDGPKHDISGIAVKRPRPWLELEWQIEKQL